MRRTWLLVAVAMTVTAGSAVAKDDGPKPGPELQRLDYFTGKWKTTGNLEATPWGPGGKFTATEKCEWFAGKWSLVCKTKGKGPGGATEGLGIMSYSPDEKVYLYYGIDNSPMTMTSIPRGTFADGTYTYEDESKVGGAPVRSRYVIQVTGSRSYTSTLSILGPDGKWQQVMTATSKKE